MTERTRVFIAPGGDPADPDSWDFVEITEYVNEPVVITRGKQAEDGTAGPSSCELTLKNDDGRFSPRNPLAPWYGKLRRNTPLRVFWDGTTSSNRRFHGFVSEWPTRWRGIVDVSRTPVTANGLLHRLGQGSQSLDSAIRRWVPRLTDYVVAYWPLEDEGGALAAGIQGVRSGTARGDVQFASADKHGSKPLLTVGGQQHGQFWLPVPSFTPVSNGWRLDFLFRMDQAPTAARNTLRVQTSSPNAARWEIQFTDPTLSSLFRVLVFNSDGTQVHSKSEAYHADVIGNWLRITLRVVLFGGSITYEAQVHLLDTPDLMPVQLHSLSDSVTGTSVGRPVRLVAGPIDENNPRSYGHVVVSKWDNSTADPFQFIAENGFPHETAGRRILRLCFEENAPLSVVGDVDDTMPMGPQPTDTFLNILRECETADGGDLHDQDASGSGLVYRTRVSKQDQAIALNLTCDDVLSDPEPTDDDRYLRNDITVSRPGGSSATATDEESVRTEGHYPDALSANVASDRRLPHIASWQKGRGTVDEMRWPLISFNPLRNGETLKDDWLALRVGDRLGVENAWPQIPGVEVDQVVDGWTERLTEKHMRVDLNCSPAAPWNNIFTMDDPDLGRLAFRAYLAEDVDDNDTSFDIVIPVRRAINEGGTFEGELLTPNAPFNGWFATLSSGFERSSEQAFRGLASGELTPSGSAGAMRLESPAARVAAGVSDYRVSAWVFSPGGGFDVRIEAVFYVNIGGVWVVPFGTPAGSQVGSYVTVPAGQWTRLTLAAQFPGWDTSTPGIPELGTVQLRYQDNPASGSDVLYVDEAEFGVQGGGLATSGVFPVDFMIGGEQVTVSAVGAMTNGIQTLTVTRSVNGIVKSHPAGTDVVLHPLPRLGLGN
jgi:hypothetical protein